MKFSTSLSTLLHLAFLASSANAFFFDFLNDLFNPTITLSIQELQSPPGSRHTDGIVQAPTAGDKAAGTAMGFVTFSNDIVVPTGGASLGTQTGHCVEVRMGVNLACYFRFILEGGSFTAEALFDLENFPNADLIITGGTGDFRGIVGTGVTENIVDDDTTFIYNFEYKILK